MSNWQDFKKKPIPKDREPLSITIDGVFTCQYCPLEADEADYFPAEGVLEWDCSAGHTSVIEKFSLG